MDKINFKNLTTILGVGMLFSSLSVNAGFKRFEAPLDNSHWQFTGNPLGCLLQHQIPTYGDATFSQQAGKDEKLWFGLSYQRQPLAPNSIAQVRAIAPSWQPMQSSRELGEVKLLNGKQVIKSEAGASWTLLNELEIGRLPTFYYQDFSNLEDQVAVSLSSVGFQPEYGKFLDCLAGLVPYRIEELNHITLYFDFDRSKIRDAYLEKLQALAQYVKHDPTLEVILISGHTDSKGSRGYNEKLSKKRVESVKKLLMSPGVDESRFKLSAYGESKPAATNRTAKGRALNRRVLLEISPN